jgi:hypothetical protein
MPKAPFQPRSPRKTATQQPFSRRVRTNPLLQRAARADDAREARRKLFLQRVAQDRDEQRYTERGDFLLRLDFNRERRLLEENYKRDAPSWEGVDNGEEEQVVLSGAAVDDESKDTPHSFTDDASVAKSSQLEQQHQPPDDETLLLVAEEEELENLVSMLDEPAPVTTSESPRYSSDEDEFDALFTEAARTENSPEESASVQGDAMDETPG